MNYKRIAGEPGDDYKRFTEFVKLAHPRYLKNLIGKTGMSLSQLKSRSNKWHWIERAKTWDAASLERTLEGELKGLERAATKEVVSCKQQVNNIINSLLTYISSNLGEFKPGEKAKLLVDLLKIGINKEELQAKLEEHKAQLDLSVLTDDEFVAYEQISKKLEKEKVK